MFGMRSIASVLALTGFAAACGSSEPAEPERAPVATSSGAEHEPRQAMAVSGLMGTIPERKIQSTLEPKLPAFARCFAQGAAEVAAIGGRMEFYFRVALDGHVEWVYPRSSTIGHRATEQCLLEVARAARFPGPKGGGAAELAWSFDIDPDARPPVEWDQAQVADALASDRGALQGCGVGEGELEVTLYAAPGGSVLGAGAAARTQDAADKIDCALALVRAWKLPDPGSYPAKVTFRAP
jgi:hypothetical protein